MSDNIDKDRIIDEALKHITKDQVRIEDMNRMAENTSELIDSLAKDVLIKLVEDIKQQSVWSMQRGGTPPNFTNLQFAIQGRVLAFITTLLRKWEYAATESMSEHATEQMKKILDDNKK